MKLIDEVKIRVLSGAGGNGCISFRREKYIPFGGPNGGNGGRGGDVYLRATRDKSSLLDFKYRPKYEAKRGQHGMGKDMDGRGGEDLILLIPQGTLVHDLETGDVIADLTDDGQSVMVAKGGKGGRGNLSFKSSTNRAPRTATPGETGETKELQLELRLIADIGLVGLPNAGKSSFLQAVSHATPKIADYPFTTLQPSLGVVAHKGQGFVIADLPGLISGASEGAGLGHRFLRHVSRNRLLLHLVDLTSEPEEIDRQIQVIRGELTAYSSDLAQREQWLVFTKTDLLSEDLLKQKQDALASLGLKGFFISSKTGAGVEALLDALAALTHSWHRAVPEVVLEASSGE